MPVLLASIDSDEKFTVAVIDHSGMYAPLLQDTGKIHFISVEKMSEKVRSKDSDYTAVIVISKDLSEDSLGATIYSHKEVPVEITQHFNSVVREKIKNERMAAYNIPDIEKIIAESKVDYSVPTVKWTDDGNEKKSSYEIAGVVGMMLTLLIYIFVLSYGGMVMQGVLEEKTNRIMEIMVSSVKPFQMMMGKIIGIALVGVAQFFIWGALIMVALLVVGSLLGSDVDPSQAMAVTGSMQGVPATVSQRTGRLVPVYDADSDLDDICTLCRYVQYPESRRPAGVVVFLFPPDITGRYDGAPALRRACMAINHLLAPALCDGNRCRMAQCQDIQGRHPYVRQETHLQGTCPLGKVQIKRLCDILPKGQDVTETYKNQTGKFSPKN